MRKLTLLFFLSINAFAGTASISSAFKLSKDSIIKENRNFSQILARNLELFQKRLPRIIRPWAEFEKTGSISMTMNGAYSSKNIKKSIVHYASKVSNIILIDEYSNSVKKTEENFNQNYKNIISQENQVKYVANKKSGNETSFWNRDNSILPVLIEDKDGRTSYFGIKPKYYHKFNGFYKLNKILGIETELMGVYFEGGNFTVDAEANCLMINNQMTSAISDLVFKTFLGCKRIIRLEDYKIGIGHVDEQVKFLSNDHIITDNELYAETLRSYFPYKKITLFPKAIGNYSNSKNKYATYINSIIVNGLLFTPVYGTKNDEKAIKLYEDAGLRVFPFIANSLLFGEGSLHCFSMNYPSTDAFNSNTSEMKSNSDSEWTDWRNTSSCSKSCGGGFQEQLRFCNEHNCKSIFEKQSISCNEQACPNLDGGWSKWKQTRACYDGYKENLSEIWSRRCDSPRVSGSGLDCQGKSNVEYKCPGPVYDPNEIIKIDHNLKSFKKSKGFRYELTISVKASHHKLVPIRCTIKVRTKKNKNSYLEVKSSSILINPKLTLESEVKVEGLKKKGKLDYLFKIDSCHYQKRTRHYFE